MRFAGCFGRGLRAAGLCLGSAWLLAGCGGGGNGSSSDSGGLPGGGSASGSGTTSYKVLAANDLGMHCVDKDYSVFSILPPYNVVNAQVVRIDSSGRPALLDDTSTVLNYTPVADRSGSINSRSADKTNFWAYAAQLFGAVLAPGEGLKGLYMPAEANAPAQTQLTWQPAAGTFRAEGIPVFPTDDAGNVNRYPLLRIVAADRASGEALASLDVVVPVSDETTCSDCHASGAVAARDTAVAWSTATDLEIQSRENVLLLHDARLGTQLMVHRPVLCASCHYSAALDLAGTGPAGSQIGRPTMSAAMHAYHASRMIDASGAAYSDRWVTQGGSPPSPERQACYLCHPGRGTQCLRGAMTAAVTCQNCHGGMSAVGGAAPLAPGGSLDGSHDGAPRRPWVDLPRCQSCHTGDATSHLTLADASLMAPDGIRTLVAFDVSDPASSPRKAAGSRFAESSGTLYRYSKGHAGIACEGCHDSTHAIWPNANDAHNDNVAATQLQGHSGTLVECSTCHGPGTLPLTIDGPHGMHVVGDARWSRGGHGSLADHDRGACAACHGADFRGTVLSRTATVRTWTLESGTRTVAKGQVVGCYDCHNGPNGGD